MSDEERLQEVELNEPENRQDALKEIVIRYQILSDKLDLILEKIDKRKQSLKE